MPTQQEQIDWLIRQVNALNDEGCGCTDCDSTPFISPNLKFSWGIASPTQTPTDYYRQVTVVGTTKNALMNVYNLELSIDNFEDIQDYNPILLIDRYKPRAKKDSMDDFRKAGFKHEPPISATANNRLSEIALGSGFEVLNFMQENYFAFNDVSNEFTGKGMSKRYNSPGNNEFSTDGGVECFVYLGFRLRLTIDGKDIETNHLAFLRMELERVFSLTDKTVTLKYKYA